MIIGEDLINWIWYYRLKKDTDGNFTITDSYRIHKFNDGDHPDVDGWIQMIHNSEGKSGINIDKYRKTGIKESYKKDHITLNTGDTIKIINWK